MDVPAAPRRPSEDPASGRCSPGRAQITGPVVFHHRTRSRRGRQPRSPDTLHPSDPQPAIHLGSQVVRLPRARPKPPGTWGDGTNQARRALVTHVRSTEDRPEHPQFEENRSHLDRVPAGAPPPPEAADRWDQRPTEPPPPAASRDRSRSSRPPTERFLLRQNQNPQSGRRPVPPRWLPHARGRPPARTKGGERDLSTPSTAGWGGFRQGATAADRRAGIPTPRIASNPSRPAERHCMTKQTRSAFDS